MAHKIKVVIERVAELRGLSKGLVKLQLKRRLLELKREKVIEKKNEMKNLRHEVLRDL